MLLIIEGRAYERRVTTEDDRLVLHAAAFDGIPGKGHCIAIYADGTLRCFDYQMVWGNLKWVRNHVYYGNRRQHPVENYLMRSKHVRTRKTLQKANRQAASEAIPLD
jgi:hypothetical protein